MTLVEVMTVVAILGAVLALATQAFLSAQSTVTAEDNRLQNLDEARVLMDTVTKDLRTAAILSGGTSPFVAAEPNHVAFYANVETTGPPNFVDISIDSTNPSAPVLLEKVTPADLPLTDPPTYCAPGGPPCGTTKLRFVGRYVTNDVSNPLFTYYDVNGQPVGTAGQALTDPEKLLVRAVGINLSVRKATSQAVPATKLVNRVRLPNVFYSVQASPTPP